ncbi:MAG: hypothetical protein KF901_15635 [Myxococcales bacterium]|nr:hypothetical protein [Myxococcales bacterium]
MALLAVASAFLGGPAAHHGEVRAELGAAPTRDEEALASLVRHGAPFALEERATVRVRLLGSGEALVSLVDVSLEPEPTLALAAGRDGPLPRDAVREAEASVEGDATVFFANVPPGDYVVRLSGEGHGELLAEVTSGGLSAPLLGVALALLLAPPLLLSIRRVTRGRSRV